MNKPLTLGDRQHVSTMYLCACKNTRRDGVVTFLHPAMAQFGGLFSVDASGRTNWVERLCGTPIHSVVRVLETKKSNSGMYGLHSSLCVLGLRSGTRDIHEGDYFND